MPAEPYLGDIMIFAGNFAPRGYAKCEGQLMSIAQNDALFALLGTTYGGDGQTTFGLPDFRGRVPIHIGQGAGLSSYVQGQMAGSESVTLLASQVGHTHTLAASSNAASTNVSSNNFPAVSARNVYVNDSSASLNGGTISATGGSQPHENRQPFLALTICIAIEGIFPSRN